MIRIPIVSIDNMIRPLPLRLLQGAPNRDGSSHDLPAKLIITVVVVVVVVEVVVIVSCKAQ